MNNIKITNSPGCENQCFELQLLKNGEYVTVAATGACVAKNIWTNETHIVHAFDSVEYVSADGEAVTASPVFSVCGETDAALTVKAGEYSITQRFTETKDGYIRVDVNCKTPEPGNVEKLMPGLFFMPEGKLSRTYDVLDFAWLPNLHLKEEHICGHHFFRSPAAVVAAGGYYAAIIPELDDFFNSRFPYALDFRAIDSRSEAPHLKYGICTWDQDGHVYTTHKRGTSAAHEKEFRFSYTVMIGGYNDVYEVINGIAEYLWQTYGDRYFKDIRPQVMPFEEYGRRYTYRYELWDTLKYDKTGERAGLNNHNRRGANFHAWENDLNVAYGINHYGQAWGDKRLCGAADAVKKHFYIHPEIKGLFLVFLILKQKNTRGRFSGRHGQPTL